MTPSRDEPRLAPRIMRLGQAILALAAHAGACNDNLIRPITELDTVPYAPSAAPPPSSFAGAPSRLEPEPDPAPPSATGRGRVRVEGGKLLTDRGSRLRGVTFGVDVYPGFPFDSALFQTLSRELGLNAFHVYLENAQIQPGARLVEADALVELTERAGMYLVIGYGGGSAMGSFDLERLRAFWSEYAPRYAAKTHVLYELQNAPELGCDAVWSDATLSMEREVYTLIRAAAPESHVLLLSYAGIPTTTASEATLDALTGIDWSNAALAFQAVEGCTTLDELPELVPALRARGVAPIISSIDAAAPLANVALFEQSELGWFNFNWLARTQNLADFAPSHEAAGVSWCPDFGSWPEPAEPCQIP